METPSLENPVQAKVKLPRPLPILPPDLIAEILTWLPVVSLLRFRSFSKCFKTLISSPDFVKAHRRCTKALSTVKPNRVDRLFRRSFNFFHRQNERRPLVFDWGSSSWSLESLYNGPRIEVAERVDVFLGVDNGGGDHVVGSCDGLLCSVVGLYHGVVVWNPCTRVVRELPAFRCDISEEQMRGCVRIFGFGYDCLLDDYKVVVAISYPTGNHGTDEFETQVQVFALKTKSWRRIEDFKYGVPRCSGVKFAAGSLYYKVPSSRGDGNPEWQETLVSLDLATEKYNKVKLPDFGDSGAHWEIESLVDRLCLASFDDGDSCVVWVMKEPRVKGAWTRLFRVDQVVVDAGFRTPLYISDDGDALWENYEDLFIYNPKVNTVRFPTSRGLPDRDGPVVIYLETLVSPEMYN
ncbi:unnamed protein product [Linum trigynum]|uniref:F-box domain-containing protein n=1 Tax=Linum trigynum TaxID=586398 RepID=A0AAV2D7F0_9ROSI